jgi:hypothetical protein
VRDATHKRSARRIQCGAALAARQPIEMVARAGRMEVRAEAIAVIDQ